MISFISRAPGQHLVDAAPIHVDHLSSPQIQALHFISPGPLDLSMVETVMEDEQDLPPLPWFGPEVSAEPAYQRRRLALEGAPDAAEVDTTNAALASLLDLLEDRVTTWPHSAQSVELDKAAADTSPRSNAPVLEPETETDEEIDDLGIEDAVIRELARSLQPRQR